MSMFVTFDITRGRLLELDGISVVGWTGPTELPSGTAFGLVTATSSVTMGDDTFVLRAGSYFVAPERTQVTSGVGLAIVVHHYHGLRALGGPIEATGRLRYIDGCTDTLLVCPPRRGEPCLNHLHVPAGTSQSHHTHDSARIGVIVRGHGRCRTPTGEIELRAGLGWYIPSGLPHAFATTDDSLDVFAWHPDSDFGPTDESHPMINRTLLEPAT